MGAIDDGGRYGTCRFGVAPCADSRRRTSSQMVPPRPFHSLTLLSLLTAGIIALC